jgi:hypothetical protein
MLQTFWYTKPPQGVPLDSDNLLTEGIVNYNTFNEGGGDVSYNLSGYRANGVLTDYIFGEISWKAGALNFPGTNEYINIPNTANLILDTRLTIVARIKVNALVNFTRVVGKEKGVPGNHRSQFYMSIHGSGEIGVGWYDTSWHEIQSSSVFVGIGTWHNIAIVLDGSAVKFYVDGIEEIQIFTWSPGNDSLESDLAIGCFTSIPNSSFFNGLIDQVIIWNRILTADDIAILSDNPWRLHIPIHIPIEAVVPIAVYSGRGIGRGTGRGIMR